MHSEYTQARIDRFWSKVDRNGPIPTHRPELGCCWVWTAGRNIRGYGKFSDSPGSEVGAHRFVWTVVRGPIPSGLWVLHHCDNPPCVRPDHLFLGTAQDNAVDMCDKGRNFAQQHPELMARDLGDRHWTRANPERLARGEASKRSRLTEAGVREIRLRYSQGETQTSLGQCFGISQLMVSKIVRRKAWAHVT